MTAPIIHPPAPDPSEPAESGPPEKSRVARIAMGITIAVALASGALWVGAILFGGGYKPAGYLTDRTFPKAAEPICAKATADLKRFPRAYESKSPTARADVIDETTDRLQRMLDDLRSKVPEGTQAKWINRWLDDWEIHISDRRDFAKRLREGGRSEEFLETVKYGTQISKSLDNYATVNKMESCATPGDV